MPNVKANSHVRVTVANGPGTTIFTAHRRNSLILICVSGEACFVTLDGSTPTATNGIPLAVGASVSLGNGEAPSDAVKAFSAGGTAILNATETVTRGS